VECLFETVEALGVGVDRAEIFWEDEVLRRGGTDDFREPSEVGWPPGGLARVAESMSKPKGLEAELRGLELAPRLFARAVADGVVFHGRAIDRGELA
jgi:hypothetical protein